MKYIRPKEAIQKYCVSRTTFVNWFKQGKIRGIRCGRGNSAHRYCKEDLDIHLHGSYKNDTEKEVILYARVSSSKQKENGSLQRQVERLKEYCPRYTRIIQEVGSGLNYNKKGLLSILDKVESGNVQRVVVTYRDRMARFGLELIERTFRNNNTIFEVVPRNSAKAECEDEQELGQDLLAVCNFFVAKNNGKRGAKLKQGRRTIEKEARDMYSCIET